MRQQPHFNGKAFIPNWVLNQLCAWAWNFVGEDGVEIIMEAGRVVFGLNPQVLAHLAKSQTAHPFKIWTRTYDGSLQYAINDGIPDADGVFDSTTAGTLITPFGEAQTVPAVGWTTIAATASLYLHLSVAVGAITVSINTTAGTSSSFAASPGIINYPIGAVTIAAGVISARNTLCSLVDLVGALIPAWYSGYAYASIQTPQHLASAAPSWDTDGACVT